MASVFCKISQRCFHTSFAVRVQVKIMKKVLHGDKNTKKHKGKFFNSPTVPISSSFSKGSCKTKNLESSKRITVLNKLFMRHITDQMATGEYSSEFVGHGIEINKVQVTSDFKLINVYWIARGKDGDEVIEKILEKNAWNLRHELSQLKVIGVVPRLQFLKDKRYAMVTEVERLLNRADFGENHIPIDSTSKLKEQLQLDVKIAPHLIKKIEQLDKEYKQEDNPLPLMTHNIFNLNHSMIMDKILKQMNQKNAPVLETEESESSETRAINITPVIYTSATEEREAFKNFFERRQALRYQARKTDKTYQPEMDYLEEEWLTKHQFEDEQHLFDDNDFIEEDDNDKF